MPTSGFQTESRLWPQVQTCDNTAGVDWCNADHVTAPVLSMLLGLHFRPHLARAEARTLRLLVPKSAAVLLRLGEHYLNLDRPDGLPEDMVPTGQVTGTGAIFTHRLKPQRAGERGARRLHTARIGQIEQQDLILGMIEPEPDFSGAPERFSRLVDGFRHALKDATFVAHSLRPRLEASGAWLLVNRASGRVIATGEAVGPLLDLDCDEIIGREYSSLAEPLRRTVLAGGLQLDNIEIAEQHLALITLLQRRPSRPEGPTDQFFSEFFAHMMRNKLSAIETAASHLGTLAAERNGTDECELAAIIQNQAEELDRQIERLRVLVDYDHLPSEEVTFAETARGVISRLDANGVDDIEIEMPSGQPGFSLGIPTSAAEVLLEAMVLTHRGHTRLPGTTRITAASSPDGAIVRVISRLAADPPPVTFRRRWQEFTSRLSRRTGLICQYDAPDEKTLITTLTAPGRRK